MKESSFITLLGFNYTRVYHEILRTHCESYEKVRNVPSTPKNVIKP